MSGGGPAVCGTLVVLGQSVVRIVSRVSAEGTVVASMFHPDEPRPEMGSDELTGAQFGGAYLKTTR